MISMIRPITPIIPRQFPAFHNADWTVLLNMSVIFLVSIFAAFCISRYAANKHDGNKSKTAWLFIGIAALVTMALFCFFGCAATTIKGIILCLILAFCSYSDLKSRECDDYPHLMIVIAAFIGIELTALPGMFLSALAVFAIMFLAMFMKATVNGADLKLATVCTFLLGFEKGVAGLLVGLLVAVIVNLIKKNKGGFPLIPYLAIGYMMAYFI